MNFDPSTEALKEVFLYDPIRVLDIIISHECYLAGLFKILVLQHFYLFVFMEKKTIY